MRRLSPTERFIMSYVSKQLTSTTNTKLKYEAVVLLVVVIFVVTLVEDLAL